MTRIDWATVHVLAEGLRTKYPFLNERDAGVLVAREAGYGYSEIGSHFGVTGWRIRGEHQRALARCQAHRDDD
jgi:hypothetical protein